MLRTAALCIIELLVLLSLTSCDLFKTRAAEDPTQQSSNYIPPTDAGQVLQNMINAFSDGNAVNYNKSFSGSTFSFEATPNARSAYGTVFLIWDSVSESEYFLKVMNHLQQKSNVTLSFEPYTMTVLGDSNQAEAVYHLTVPHMVSGVTKKFNGRAQFILVRNQLSIWSIRRWSDFSVNVADSTWSDLKGIAISQW